MSAQDNLERTLKEIHVLFSKCESPGDDPNQIIVDKKKLLDLLDDLNRAVFAVMDSYENTKESRTRAELAFQQKGRKMIEDASQRADDIYAASVLYTSDAIGEMQSLMDQVNESMNEMFRTFRTALREQKDQVRRNELELEADLQDLKDSRLYQQMLEDIRAAQRRQQDAQQQEFQERAQARRRMQERIYTPATNADVKINESYFEQQGISAEDAKAGYVPSPAPLAAERPEVKINYDSEYFKRKAAMDAEQTEGQNPESADAAQEPEDAWDRSADVQIPADAWDEVLPGDEFAAVPAAEEEPERKTSGEENAGGKREVPGWRERMKILLNEIAPKDLDEK